MAITVLINPEASSGNGIKIWNKVKKILDERKVSYIPHILDSPGKACDITAALTEDLKEDLHILVIGGDGTLNETLNGIGDFEHTKLSCVRSGSGNDFAIPVSTGRRSFLPSLSALAIISLQ